MGIIRKRGNWVLRKNGRLKRWQYYIEVACDVTEEEKSIYVKRELQKQ